MSEALAAMGKPPPEVIRKSSDVRRPEMGRTLSPAKSDTLDEACLPPLQPLPK